MVLYSELAELAMFILVDAMMLAFAEVSVGAPVSSDEGNVALAVASIDRAFIASTALN